MAQAALRTGEVMVRIKATFRMVPQNDLRDADSAAADAEAAPPADVAESIQDIRYFLVAKPFFRPYMLVLCQVSNPVDGEDSVRITHPGNTWQFCTSLQLCTELLQKHGGCTSISMRLVDYKPFSRCCSLNVLPLNGVGGGEGDGCSVFLFFAIVHLFLFHIV